MKVLYFTRGQSPHDIRFTQALSTSGHSAAVLCLEDTGSKPWPKGIEVLTWPERPAKYSFFNAQALAKVFRRVVENYQPDVVHAGPIQRTAFIAALAGFRPLVSMSWGSDLLLEAKKSPFWGYVTRYTLARTTVLTADCQTVVEAARHYGCMAPAHIFPWGVDLDHFKPGVKGNLRKQLGWQDKFVFLCSRTMEPLYGVEVVAKAFIQAAARNPDLRLLLFGRGAQETAIRGLLKEAGVMDRVHFGGFADLEQLPDVYRSTDVYVSASHSDGSSVSLMEALACGVPALVSDIPSNREWVETGREGWLFRDGETHDLADKMLAVAVNRDMKQLSKKARSHAEERADWQKNFQILLEAYQHAIEIEKGSTK